MMHAEDTFAFVGLLAHSVLALLFAAVWRLQRARWAACFGAVFAVLSLIFLFDAQWRPVNGQAHPMPLLLGMSGAALMALGIIDLVALPARARRLLEPLAIAGPALIWLTIQFGGPPRAISGGLGLMYAGLCGLVLWAAWRQRDLGHLMVFGVFMLFPGVFAAALAGLIPVGLVRYASAVPTLLLGMTVLTQGLLRAHRRAQHELARREQAEQALQALNESLEQRVTQRTAELNEMVEGLESFNRSVSHDLRGPLGGIAGVSRLARDALGRRDFAAAERMLDVITTQADASAKLVAALLALARVGDATLKPCDIDLDAFVRDTLAQMREAEAAPVELPVTVQPLPHVHADPDLLRQVVVNLVGNAVKFSREVAHPQIEVGALPAGAVPASSATPTASATERVVYVRDNGVGFDMQAGQRLFEPFQRLHGAQRFAGHGVGLSIVKRIVERHGGHVWAESAPNRGATFYFSLPA